MYKNQFGLAQFLVVLVLTGCNEIPGLQSNNDEPKVEQPIPEKNWNGQYQNLRQEVYADAPDRDPSEVSYSEFLSDFADFLKNNAPFVAAIKGDAGDAGAQGASGTQGVQGVQGVQGPVGPQGVAGPKGEAKYDKTLLYRYAATEAPNSDFVKLSKMVQKTNKAIADSCVDVELRIYYYRLRGYGDNDVMETSSLQSYGVVRNDYFGLDVNSLNWYFPFNVEAMVHGYYNRFSLEEKAALSCLANVKISASLFNEELDIEIFNGNFEGAEQYVLNEECATDVNKRAAVSSIIEKTFKSNLTYKQENGEYRNIPMIEFWGRCNF